MRRAQASMASQSRKSPFSAHDAGDPVGDLGISTMFGSGRDQDDLGFDVYSAGAHRTLVRKWSPWAQ